MEIKTSLIDIDSIRFHSDDSKYNAQEVLYLANAIAKLGDLICIPSVHQIDFETFELATQFFEYHAFLKAREINLEIPSRIRVFIIPKQKEEAFLEQIYAINQLNNKSKEEISEDSYSISIKNIFSKLDEIKNDIQKSSVETKIAFNSIIEENIPKKLPALEAFNQILDPNVSKIVYKNLSFLQKRRRDYIINRLQEYKQANQDHTFKTFSEVHSILEKGWIAKEKMLEIIDNWE